MASYLDVCGCYAHFGARGKACPACEFAVYCKKARDDESKLCNQCRRLDHPELIPAPESENAEENELIQAYKKIASFFLSLDYRDFLTLQIHFRHPEYGWRRLAEAVRKEETKNSWATNPDNSNKRYWREDILKILEFAKRRKK